MVDVLKGEFETYKNQKVIYCLNIHNNKKKVACSEKDRAITDVVWKNHTSDTDNSNVSNIFNYEHGLLNVNYETLSVVAAKKKKRNDKVYLMFILLFKCIGIYISIYFVIYTCFL